MFYKAIAEAADKLNKVREKFFFLERKDRLSFLGNRNVVAPHRIFSLNAYVRRTDKGDLGLFSCLVLVHFTSLTAKGMQEISRVTAFVNVIE